MHFFIDFELTGLQQRLATYKTIVNRPKKLLDQIGAEVLRENQQRHDKSVAPDGTPWAPLAKSTLHAVLERRQHRLTKIAGKSVGARSDYRAAQKIMDAKKILRDRGDLLRFFYQVRGDAVVITTMDQIKAQWHHFGTGKFGPRGQSYEIKPKTAKALSFHGVVRNKVNHPGIRARPLVGFPSSDQAMVRATVVAHLQMALSQK